jgi:prepilin-type processing-associated H-X9-DG protein
MKISQFTNMMHQKGADQVIITTDEPLQVFIGGQWKKSTTIIPSESAVSGMLEECIPANLQGTWRLNDTAFSFPYATVAGEYEIAVKSVQGKRTITITDKKTSTNPSVQASTTSTTARLRPGGGGSGVDPTKPPNIPAVAWYHNTDGKQVGPISSAEIAQCISLNIVKPETLVWHEGMQDWKMAKLTELESLFQAQPPPPPPSSSSGTSIGDGNTSGEGALAIVPSELHGFNWGAFLLAPWWAISHGPLWGWAAGTFFPGLIPYIGGLINLVVAGIMGNQGYELAWKHRKWRDVEHCQEVQRIWTRWGIGVVAVSVVLGLFIFVVGLSPVFSRARENARRASCQSNLKEISLAIFMYAQDHEEKYPPAFGTGNPAGWADAILPYSKDELLFTCPSDEKRPSGITASNVGYSSYRYNSDLSWLSDSEIDSPWAGVLIAEGTDTDPHSNATYSGQFGFQGILPESPTRHFQGANYAFMDGHVRWYPSSSMDASMDK